LLVRTGLLLVGSILGVLAWLLLMRTVLLVRSWVLLIPVLWASTRLLLVRVVGLMRARLLL
jgi:hypothetical protein